MAKITLQIIKQLQVLTAGQVPVARSAAEQKTDPMLTIPSQLLFPTASWNWPVAPIGTILDVQYQFADTMPQSSESGVLFSPSANSFSTNYRMFLDSITANNFPLKKALRQAKKAIQMPAGSPSTGIVPPGWTVVTIAGVNRWAPIWDVQPTAAEWKNDVETGAISNPGTINIQLERSQEMPTAQDKHVLAQKGPMINGLQSLDGTASFTQVSITASAWGQIPIYPGTWFNGSMISLGKDYLENKDTFFGPSGLLSCRVAAFFVAYKPSFKLSSPSPIPSTVRAQIKAASELYALGTKVRVGRPSRAARSVALQSVSSDPVIVALALEVFS